MSSLEKNTWLLDEWYAQEYANPATYSGAHQLWTWGFNEYGQLGQNKSGNPGKRSSPVQIPGTSFQSFSYGSYVTTENELYVWGDNGIGQLGLNKSHPSPALRRSSPTQIPGSWSGVSREASYSMAVKTDGTLWTWGSGIYGSLGTNITTPGNAGRSSPVQVGTGTDWASGYQKLCVSTQGRGAIKTDGTLWIWGDGTYGQFAENSSNTQYSSPVQVGTGTDWKTYSANYMSIAALKTDGTLWTWGRNQYGSLGQNNTNQYESPKQIPGSWSYATMGYQYMHATKTDGTLWCWGRNASGSLGNNQTQTSPSGPGLKQKSSPVQIPGTNWDRPFLMEKNNNGGAIKTDGTLWMWGSNSQGQLGVNDINQRSSPTQVGTDTNWQKALATNETVHGLKLF